VSFIKDWLLELSVETGFDEDFLAVLLEAGWVPPGPLPWPVHPQYDYPTDADFEAMEAQARAADRGNGNVPPRG
jgi:hypothetical protein